MPPVTEFGSSISLSQPTRKTITPPAPLSICRLVACESRGAECAVIYLTCVRDIVILAVPVVRVFERAPRCPVRCAAYRSAVNGDSDVYFADIRAAFLEVAQSLFGLLEGTLISVDVVSVIRHELNLVETIKSLL